MKQKIDKLYSKVGLKSDRTKNITKHVVISFLYKGGSILTSFLLVPLTINFLDTENYGIWLTLSSFISWFSFFDIGLGNGLRNKFAEAKANGDLTLAKAYVSTAYFTIGTVCLLLTLVFLALNFFIDWTNVFNANAAMQKDLGILMPIVFSFFCLQLVVKLITTIYTADQYHSMQGKVTFYSSALSLLAIWIMTHFAKSSLLIFGAIFSVLPVLFLVGLNLVAFSNRYKEYKPSFVLWKKKYLKDIFRLGFSFFIIQIFWLIINTTDNFIIAQMYSPKEVVPYNLSYKLFAISSMMFSIIAAPYWSTFTEAYAKKDFLWIKKSMKNLRKISLFFILFSSVIFFFADILFTIWLGKDSIKTPIILNMLMLIYSSLIILIMPLNFFLNGIGKIKLQLIQTIVMGIFNVPISIFFALYFNIGGAGVLLGTIFCILPGLIVSKIQCDKIIIKKAVGIWNQ